MFKSLFGKKKVEETPVVADTQTSKIFDDNLDLNGQIEWLESNKWLKTKYVKSNKNILIMDDRDEIISSVIDDLEALDTSNSFNIDNFNIIAVSSKMAGFDVLEILSRAPDINIDFALLDIVLGGKKVVDGKRTMVDGIDIAIKIWEQFPRASILFFSGCIIENSPDQGHFKTRFDTYTNDDLNNFIMPKDISIDDELNRLSEFFNGF